MLLHTIPEAQLREGCVAVLASLEMWLRRLIDDHLRGAYGDSYLDAKAEGGTFLLRSRTREGIRARFEAERGRYNRLIDAAVLEDEIYIITHPELYSAHFHRAMSGAFPGGREMV